MKRILAAVLFIGGILLIFSPAHPASAQMCSADEVGLNAVKFFGDGIKAPPSVVMAARRLLTHEEMITRIGPACHIFYNAQGTGAPNRAIINIGIMVEGTVYPVGRLSWSPRNVRTGGAISSS